MRNCAKVPAKLKKFLTRKECAALLEKYQDGGLSELENLQVLRHAPFSNIGSPATIVKLFGGKSDYLNAVKQLKKTYLRGGVIYELENLRRKNWAVDNKDGKALTGDNLLNFINTEFFSTLKNVSVIDTRQQN